MTRTISLFLVGLVIALLAGCASQAQTDYYAASKDIATARSAAIKELASGGDAARVAGIMALTFGAQGQQLAAPRDGWDRALQAIGILTPALVQTYGIQKQTQLGIVQSNNGLAASRDANATMLGFGGLINAPVVVEQPAPVIVQQPAPVIVDPVVVNPIIVQPVTATPAQ